MNIRRLLLDVDKALGRPSLLDIGNAIAGCAGVKAFNMSVGDVDVETMGLEVTIEGEGMDYVQIEKAIEDSGSVGHGIEQSAAGDRIIERAERAR